jgi:hypothetical protein
VYGASEGLDAAVLDATAPGGQAWHKGSGSSWRGYPYPQDARGGAAMTAEHTHGEEPLIPMPALTLDALRRAVAVVAPSRLPEFFQEIQDAFSQAGDEDSVFPIRHFYQRWGATVAIERRPSVAARLHAAERALANPDAEARDRAIREAAEIVQAAYREVAGGRVGLGMHHR